MRYSIIVSIHTKKIIPLFLLFLFIALGSGCREKPNDAAKKGKEATTANLNKNESKGKKDGEHPSPPRRIIEKTIAAHGGRTKLKEKLSAYTLHTQGERWSTSFQGLTSWRAPSTLLMVLNLGAQRILLNDERCIIQDKGVSFPCSQNEYKKLFITAWMTHLSHLYPLLEGDITLEHAETPKPGFSGKPSLAENTTYRADKKDPSKTEDDEKTKSDTKNKKNHQEFYAIVATQRTTRSKQVSSKKIHPDTKTDGEAKKSEASFSPVVLPPVTLLIDKKTFLLSQISSLDQPHNVTRFYGYEKTQGIMLAHNKKLFVHKAPKVKERIKKIEFGEFKEKEAKQAQQTQWEKRKICNLSAAMYTFSKHSGHYESFKEPIKNLAGRMYSDGLIITGPPEVALLKPFSQIDNIRKIPLEIRIPTGRVRTYETSPGGLVTKKIKARRGVCMPTKGTLAQALDRLFRLKGWVKGIGHKPGNPIVRVFPATGDRENHAIYELIVPFR